MKWLFLCLLPLFNLSLQELDFLNHDRYKYELCNQTLEWSYPVFSGTGSMIEYANGQLKTDIKNWLDSCANFSDEEPHTLSYRLFPTYQSPNLISVYGSNFQGGGGHGCTYYEGKTFWQTEGSIVELSLDDLFIKDSGYRQFLLQYCENYFKSSGYGYYASCPEYEPHLKTNDLDIFVLTDRGLRIIFRAYVVGGWADGPDTVLIPYENIKGFIDITGPLQEML
jgi:hypothetical protein